MMQLWREIRTRPLLWLLVFVPAALVAHRVLPASETLLFALSALLLLPVSMSGEDVEHVLREGYEAATLLGLERS